MTCLPAARPCGSCPYRRDVPSGVWAEDEYAKLPGFDGETWEQTPAVFYCHQQDGRLCAGWAAVHDMGESFGLRVAVMQGIVTPEEYDALLDYTTDAPVFSTGAEAAEHGMRDVAAPAGPAVRVIDKLTSRRGSTASARATRVRATEDDRGGRPESESEQEPSQ